MTGLPQGWAQSQLSDWLDISTGKLDANAFVGDGQYPFFTCAEAVSRIDTPAFDCQAVLLAGNGNFNLHKYSGKFNAYQRTYVLEPIEVDLGFAFLAMKQLLPEITKDNRGSTIKYLRLGDITNTVAPLPPLPEQRRIVRKLDTLTARTTTARTHLTVIEKLVERMKGAVLSQALNGKLLEEQAGQGELTELGEFILGIEQGWSPKCENEVVTDREEWAVLTTTAIQPITFDCNENKRLPAAMTPRQRLEVQTGNILMTRAGPRVRCAVCCYVAETLPKRIFSDKVYRITLNEKVEPEFFVMIMNAPEMVCSLDEIKSGGSESGLNLTQGRLKELAINLWDRSIQKAVIADVKEQFAKIDRLATEAAKALKLLDHLDQRILAKAFAGDLVPQDPNDEPAETLLVRIRAERASAPKPKRGRKTSV